MAIKKRVQLDFSAIITSLIFIMALVYFTYHAISGERGLLAMIELNQKVEQSKKQLDSVLSEKVTIEHKVKLLSDASIDLDMLDEQARRHLGYAKEGEIVLIGQFGKAAQ